MAPRMTPASDFSTASNMALLCITFVCPENVMISMLLLIYLPFKGHLCFLVLSCSVLCTGSVPQLIAPILIIHSVFPVYVILRSQWIVALCKK